MVMSCSKLMKRSRVFHSQFGQVDQSGRDIEQSDHHALAKAGGQAGDAQVDVAIADLHRRAAVLRKRFSAMFIRPITFTRLITSSCTAFGKVNVSYSTPSIRMRIITVSFIGLNMYIRCVGLDTPRKA